MRTSVAVQSEGSRTRSPVLSVGVQGVDQVQVRKGDELVLQQFSGRGCGLSAGWVVIQRPPALFEVCEPLG